MKAKQCGSCGSKAMVRDIRDASRTYNGEIITVVAVDAWFCEGCGEIEFAGALFNLFCARNP